MRKVFVGVFFFLQVIGIAYSRFVDERYFCWAPFDQINYYKIKSIINGVELTSEQIKDRYHIPAEGQENRSIHNVFTLVSQYEKTYGNNDFSRIEISFQTNGKEVEKWSFNSE